MKHQQSNSDHKPHVVADGALPGISEALRDCARVSLYNSRLPDRDLLAGADALLVRSLTPVNEQLLKNSPATFVGSATSGIDHIDTDYLRQRGITFADAHGCNANAVAEYVLFSICAHARRHDYDPAGCTLGIFGFGAVGSLLAAYALKLGMKVLINDPPLRASGAHFPAGCTYVEPDELCAESDVVSTHVPLTSDGPHPTVRLIDADRLELFRSRALLVHASRGGVVDERALLATLLTKQLGMALDVWQYEPLASVMLARAAFPATPHIAGYSLDAKLEGSRMVTSALAQHFGLRPRRQAFDLPSNDIELDMRKADDIYRVLDKSRRLTDDTQLFRQSLFADDSRRADAFERMRRQYTLRRESLRRPTPGD